MSGFGRRSGHRRRAALLRLYYYTAKRAFPQGVPGREWGRRGENVPPGSALAPADDSCIRALREIGANIGIDQFVNWSINTALRCLTLIRVIRVKRQNKPPPKRWRFIFGAPAGTNRGEPVASQPASPLFPLAQKTLSRFGVRGFSSVKHAENKQTAHGGLLVFGAPAGTDRDTLLKKGRCLPPELLGEGRGMAGSEPTISESKSGVLPLHYIPESLCGKRPALPASFACGVGYGARTHDTRNHNPVLYQLS